MIWEDCVSVCIESSQAAAVDVSFHAEKMRGLIKEALAKQSRSLRAEVAVAEPMLKSVAVCSTSGALAKNLKVTLSPSDPKPGDEYATVTDYDLDEQITGGTATYKATLSGFPIVNQKDDLCTDLKDGQTPCPLGPGHIHSDEKSTVPTGVHGQLASTVTWTATSGTQILCLELHFSL